MGLTSTRVRIANLADPTRAFEDEFLIDTGALFSFAPAEKLLAIGAVPAETKILLLADGTSIQRRIGDVYFEVVGIPERRAAPVIFAEPSDAKLLGVLSLEALGLKVNPITGDLEPAPLLAVGARARP